MIDDDLFERFPKPDVVLGQHLMVGRAGDVAGSSGPITSAADSPQIRMFGRGAHGSMPQASIDPVVTELPSPCRASRGPWPPPLAYPGNIFM
jgi:metal-dependent amidase/aminoacylase/carboxypeptidase family protein